MIDTEDARQPGPREAGPRRAGRARFARLTLMDSWGALAVPVTGFLLVVFVLPLVVILARSFTDPAPGVGNYRQFFAGTVYIDVLTNTFVMAIAVTLVCLAIGYPYAYLMTLATSSWRGLLMVLVLVPFWTSLLVRSFALLLLLRDTGALNESLQGLGLISEPIMLVRNFSGVLIGMVQVMLPFMVLPLYATMRGLDRRLLDAAQSLGARPAFAFWRIFVPLSTPGIAAGALLVFIQSLGFYITPALLGGSRNMMLGELIVEQVSTQLNWGFAAAMATILLATTLVLLAVASRFVDVRGMPWSDR